mgnify:CR=1 FL=1
MSSAPPLSLPTQAPRKRPWMVRRRWGSDEVLAVALAVSLALHGLLLAIHFHFPDFKLKRGSDKNLEVVLVNARHAKAPDKADALAQANLDGGGGRCGRPCRRPC